MQEARGGARQESMPAQHAAAKPQAPATNHRTKRVSVDRDTEITLIRTIARSLVESSTKDLT